jgi:hypothetical protein
MIEVLPTSGPLALFSNVIEERVEKTLKSMIHFHNNGTLTPEAAQAGIATIAGLRLALADVKERLRNPKEN